MPFIRYRLLVLPDGTTFSLRSTTQCTTEHCFVSSMTNSRAFSGSSPCPRPSSFRDYVSYMHSTDRQKSLKFWQELLQNNAAPFPEVEHPLASALTVPTVELLCQLSSKPPSRSCSVASVVEPTSRTTPSSQGRNVELEEAQTIAGTCANFLPFRSAFNDETRVRELLKLTQSLFWKTTEHGNVGLKDIYQSLGSEPRRIRLSCPCSCSSLSTSQRPRQTSWRNTCAG